jgi:hypothetical protein
LAHSQCLLLHLSRKRRGRTPAVRVPSQSISIIGSLSMPSSASVKKEERQDSCS